MSDNAALARVLSSRLCRRGLPPPDPLKGTLHAYYLPRSGDYADVNGTRVAWLRPEEMFFRMAERNGFTLVELMVVVAIVAILAAVATPAYINYVNRTKQGNAESLLMTARLEEESFYTDNGHFASTIQCLPSFAGTNTACIGSCTSAICTNSFSDNNSGYSFAVVASPTSTDYQVQATRAMNGANDVVTISGSTDTPWVKDTTALHFSIFKWLFGH